MNVIIHHGMSEEEAAAATTAASRVADFIADLNSIGVEASCSITVSVSLSIVKPATTEPGGDERPAYDARPQSVIGPN